MPSSATNSSTTGYAGYFVGNVNITGDSAISGTTTLNNVTITGTCNGCVGTGSQLIGSVTTAATSFIFGEPTSGFYTTGANVIAIEENGVPVEQWNTLGSGVDYLNITPGKANTPITIAATSTGGTDANPSITITTTGAGNITLTPGTTGNFMAGVGVSATGGNAVALGTNTVASGQFSTALGDQTTASGEWSTALGYGTVASAGWSTAIGFSATATGDGSVALGPCHGCFQQL